MYIFNKFMNDDNCSICFEPLNQNNLQIYSLDCGHRFHTDCIIKNTQMGNISCPNCRTLPNHIIDQELSIEEREKQIREYNKKQIQLLFLKGIRKSKNKNLPDNLKNAIKKYNKAKNNFSIYNKNRIQENKLFKLMNNDIKLLKKNIFKELNLKIKNIKNNYKNLNLLKRVPKNRINCKHCYKSFFRREKKEIAVAMGYQQINY